MRATTAVLGREHELGVISEFLADGPSPTAALLLEGAAGIGKTTLWQRAVEFAEERGYRVLSSRPAEPDSGLSFAGVGDLLAGVIDAVLARLSGAQRSALEVALLLTDRVAPVPDQGALAFGFLNALRLIARDGAIAIAIDDVQWLDAPSAHLVEFAARRLRAEPVRFLLAVRSGGSGRDGKAFAQALPGRSQTLSLGALSLGALFELLGTVLGQPPNRSLLRQLHEASGGNPLHALEIGRALERQGWRVEPGGALPVPDDLRGLVGERVGALPAHVREALLAASVSSDPRLALLEAVTDAGSELDAAVEAGVIAVDGERIRFVHPLFASAIRAQAGAGRLRHVHRRLAEHAVSGEVRALHLALGSSAPDERAAAELAEAARAACARGAPITGAAFFEHALRLAGPSRADRRSWETELAQACFEAGDLDRASEVLETLVDRLPEGNERADALWRLAVLTCERVEPAAWVRATERALLEVRGDVALEAGILSELSWAALFVNDLESALRHARRAVEVSDRHDDADAAAPALTSLCYMEFIAGVPVSVELIERALVAERAAKRVRVDRSPRLMHAFALVTTGDFAAARPLLADMHRVALDRGDESNLSVVLRVMTLLETHAGSWQDAAAYAREAVELAEQTGVNRHEALDAAALVDAHRGRVADAERTARTQLARAEEDGSALFIVRSLALLGFVELSRGDAREAQRHLARATEVATALGVGEPGLLRFVPDHVEALVALGRVEEAGRVLEPFEEAADRLGREWAVAAAGRCRGLVLDASGDRAGAVAALERAREGHRVTEMPFELGRTLLVLGTAQRRARQRRAARQSLDEALALFEQLGAPLWAARTQAELGRIAGRAPASDGLTPAEARIAERVARGLSNREVAAELVIEVHTVEAALTRIYSKLGVRSRVELARRSVEDVR
jgi:DNA-binding CsgD family transcriptional regulator